MKIVSFFIFLFVIVSGLNGQVTLEGKVLSTTGESLARINILVYLPGSEVLIAFGVTDEKGNFKTSVKSPSDSLRIEVSSIQYRNVSRVIANSSQLVNIEMTAEEQELKGVTVRAKAIEQRGDTLSFLVSSFARDEDRSIEEVLRRMPGIEVEPSGRILYQGLPLNKFYVEGLDLMDGRYGVVSKNLPQKSVGTVEIMENHQPLKILEERVSSQQAALNLKLKRDVTTTGTAKLGAGAAPFLWDVNLTPMTFTKSFQVVSSYQTNNTGNDVSQQLRMLIMHDLLRNIDRPNENPGMLGIQDVSAPRIDQNRYLDNNVHLINLNGLQKINNDFQLRANLYFINDYQQEQASLKRTLYTPTDTLSFTEVLENRDYQNYLMGKFTLGRNVKKNYLSNELKVQSRWDTRNGAVNTENEVINQSLDDPIKSISNTLRSVIPIGNHLVEVNSYISYDITPQTLAVNPGQFQEALNDSLPYDKVKQKLELNRFYTDNSASLVLGLKRFTFTPRAGLAYRRQNLETEIFTTVQELEVRAGEQFTNMLEGRQSKAYVQTEIEYKKRNLSLIAKLPLSWQQVYLDELNSEQGQELQRVLFDPDLSADYKFRNFWRIRASWRYTNRLGDLDNIHYAYILKSYRNLGRNAAPLSETSNQNFSVHLAYRNPISSFFNTLTYVYSVGHTNLTYSIEVNDDGTTVTEALDLPQTTHTQALNFYTSKYFSATKTTLTLHASTNWQQGKSLMNKELFSTQNRFYNIRPELNVRITPRLNSEYGLEAAYFETYIEEDLKSTISLLKHKLKFFAFPARDQLVSIETEYYDYNDANNFFVDLLYRYTFSKKRLDFELRWSNIFNNETYTSLQAGAFSVYESEYAIRPSQVLVSIKFSF